jgi:hypothetical protein
VVNKNTLLVEGRDDQFVLFSLFEYYQIPDKSIDVRPQEGIDGVLQTLEAALAAGSPSNILGVLVDADSSPNNRWQAIKDRLTKASYNNIPANLNSAGTIIMQPGKPTVGVWLMPNNTLPGMLENFVSSLIPDRENDPLWKLSENCVQEAIKLSLEIPQAKAHIHTYLAWQKEPGSPLGLSITKKYLDPGALPAHQFINWLRQLYNLV